MRVRRPISKDDLEYLRLLISTMLLLLLVPLVLHHVWRNPSKAADKALGGLAR